MGFEDVVEVLLAQNDLRDRLLKRERRVHARKLDLLISHRERLLGARVIVASVRSSAHEI